MTPEQTARIYEQFRPMIRKLVIEHARQYRMNPDEVESEANEIFVEAIRNRMDPTRSCLSTWIHTSIRMGLKTRTRNLRTWQRYHQPIVRDHAHKVGLTCKLLFGKVSRDARCVLLLVMDPPEEVEQEALRHECRPKGMRIGIRSYLAKEGWGRKRIQTAFEEIRRAMQ